MIKSFKIFENNNEPQVGDYVLCEDSSMFIDADAKKFIDNNIGKIVKKIKRIDFLGLLVEYKNVPSNFFDYFQYLKYKKGFFREMNLSEIKYWSKNKKDVESYIIGKKYNL